MDPEPEVIVLSDDDDDDEDTGGDNSVFIVEENDQKKGIAETNEILDEDVTITFSQKANVLPHARYDCTISFSFTDSNVSEPDSNNAAFCEQCFCYVCDKLASQCKLWSVPGFCHCNAHKRSVYWKSLRDKRIMGYLHELRFTFNPGDMDSDLRRAETSLQDFAHSLVVKYMTFLTTTANPDRQIGCGCLCHSTNSRAAESGSAYRNVVGCSRCYIEHQKHFLYDYSPVMEHVSDFLNTAVKENPKASSVMALGAVKLFVTHAMPGSEHTPAISGVVQELCWRAISLVQVLLVTAELPAPFIKQLQLFFHSVPLPPDFRKFRNGINVVSWDDPLLSGVLKGQNVTGIRYVKGRRPETLDETAMVVRTRVHKLQQQHRYRELTRYLKVVKSDSAAMLQIMRDWVPLYFCKVGDYTGAVDSLLSPLYGLPASRLSPAQFGAYLKIFTSGHAPCDIPHPPHVEFSPYSQSMFTGQTDPLLSSTWTPIEGGCNLLKRQDVLKFALRVLNCNNAVFVHAESWIKVLRFVSLSPSSALQSSSPCLPEPDYNFLIRTRDVAVGILNELNRTSRIQIPKSFQNEYPDQALLLLATQALALRLLHSRLQPVLTVLLTFTSNPWVLRWLFSSLLVQPQMLNDLFFVTVEELLDRQCKSVLRIEDASQQVFIASLLSLFFLEPSVVLHHNAYPVTELLAKWNEIENPWQYHLRGMLKVQESNLSMDKQQILYQMSQRGLRQ